MKLILFFLFSNLALADARNVIGNSNKLTPDPAMGDVKRDSKTLREEIKDLDRPSNKEIEKTPNQILEEKKQKSVPR